MLFDKFKNSLNKFQTKVGFGIICHISNSGVQGGVFKFQTKVGFGIICHKYKK